jgi:AcrR family transcriptional regulator
MSTLSSPSAGRPARVRRLRSDGERNIAAILEAAERVLGARPDASMEEIAREAGFSRQTLYAHFTSREAVVRALFDRALDRTTAAVEQADLRSGSAAEALQRFVLASWDLLEQQPFLLNLRHPDWTPDSDEELHDPILEPLRDLISRGQRAGEMVPDRSARWLAGAVIALGHLAATEFRDGHAQADEARDAWLDAVVRLTRQHPAD